MHQHSDIFKAVAQMQLCGTAKLIALAIRIHNTLDVTALMELTGESRRVVQLYRAQYIAATSEGCETRETGFAKDAKDAKPVSSDAKNVSPSRPRVEDNNIITLPVDRPESKKPSAVVGALAKPTKPKQQPRGARLDAEWTLPDGWKAWTQVNCLTATVPQIEVEALKFANYWHSLAGQKACKLDWFRTWQNWCLTAFATAPTRPYSPLPPGKKSALTILAEMEAAGAV